MARKAIYKQGNAGIVTVTAAALGDLCHTLSLRRSAIITKILAYNVTGGPVTLQFGTHDRLTPTFVPLLPLLVCVNGVDNEWNETDLPPVEFVSWPQLTAAGRTGDIYVVSSGAGPTVIIEVKEIGG